MLFARVKLTSAWLRDLGLVQYEDRFRENEIEADVLLDLEADLEKLGLPLGPRKRILKAIAIAESRFEVRVSGPTAIGRDHEPASMLEWWKQANIVRKHCRDGMAMISGTMSLIEETGEGHVTREVYRR